MAASDSVIDLDAPLRPFDPDKWIGKGQKFPHPNVHPEVEKALDHMLTPPTEALQMLPSPHLAVVDLLDLKLPKLSAAICTTKRDEWFCAEEPHTNWNLTALSNQPIPSPETLVTLKKAVGQAWLDGAKSLVDLNLNDGQVRMPLWVLAYWIEAGNAIEVQRTWHASERWLRMTGMQTPAAKAVMDEARAFLYSLGWKSPVSALGASTTTLELARLLGTQWISSQLIDMMMEQLGSRVRIESGITSKDIIGPLMLGNDISSAARRGLYDTDSAPGLQCYEGMIEENRVTHLYFPINVGETHWVAMSINFEAKTIACGDSLNYQTPVPTTFINHVQKWLRACFRGPFNYLGNLLVHGNQEDHISCRICTANTISHATLGDALWNKHQCELEHAQWFSILACCCGFQNGHTLSEDQDTTYLDNNILMQDAQCTAGSGTPALTSHETTDAGICNPMSLASLVHPVEMDYLEAPQADRNAGSCTSDTESVFWDNNFSDGDALSEAASDLPVPCSEYDAVSTSPSVCSSPHLPPPDLEMLQPGAEVTSEPEMASSDRNPDTSTSRPKKAPRAASVQQDRPMHPFFRLKEHDHPRITDYICRPSANSAGGHSVISIAKKQFGKPFADLRSSEKNEVCAIQKHQHCWKLDKEDMNVMSLECLHNVPASKVDDAGHLAPCEHCLSLLLDQQFKRTINKDVPEGKNYRYTNQRYCNEYLSKLYAEIVGLKELIDDEDARNSPWVKFACNALQGKYEDQKVFTGLVAAMVSKVNREEHDVGMQNFRYSPTYDTYLSTVQIISPQNYRLMSEYFQTRTEHSVCEKESKQPKFPMEICLQTFKLVSEHLKILGYDGPIGLSCDETKLFGNWQLYWNKERDSYFLIGADCGPLLVLNPEVINALLKDPEIRKAEKVRIFVLQPPMLKVTPIIVAAIPVNSLSAELLLSYLEQIVYGLLDENIQVVSYACDGTEVERSLQCLFTAQATDCITYHFEDSRVGYPPLEFIIPVFRGQPIVMIQDSKHALKTFCNNLFSGARLLVLGNFVAIYAHIQQLAFESGGPLYHCDVEKLDRQDDNAATRLFSAETLCYLTEHHPEYVGEIIYLFVFGELVDAYQNCWISHSECIKMALCAQYFMNYWKTFLDSTGYQSSRYFLSREAADITQFLIHGLISLILVYHDHTDQ
ncbi:hypothetical protein EWM64_g5890 [Hericium alpestre]|uniref:Ubiquitin-like protease family profile domain-containing protein n=1 Tax=Hericium alpestre TaxID=135208 RepID=A0A4Y9ZW52_9AGAM|nr:hypothetical protein EWM64_g5890 [Hericium alpestre]